MIFAVDGGGTTFKTCLVEPDGAIRRIESFPLRPEEGIAGLSVFLHEILSNRSDECKREGKAIRAIGIGCRGIIDSENVRLLDDSGIMNFFAGHSFTELFEEWDFPIAVENDAVAATLGEIRYGIGQSVSNFLLLTLGTGIGGGIVIDGKVYKGHTGMAGHLGHFPVNPEGDRCGCGNIGCVETEFSAGAFKSRISILNEGRPDSERIGGTRQLFDVAQGGDEEALAIVRRGVFYLARAISGYANAFDPEKIVLSGGVARAGDFLMDLLVEELNAILWRKDPREFLCLSDLSDKMGLYGAGAVGAAMLERDIS